MGVFRLSQEHYDTADIIVAKIFDNIIPHTYHLTPAAMGEYFLSHKQEIFEYFETCPQSWRFPLLLRNQPFQLRAAFFANRYGTDMVSICNAFLYCMHFYLHLNTLRMMGKLAKKYPNGSMFFSVERLVEDEIQTQLMGAW